MPGHFYSRPGGETGPEPPATSPREMFAAGELAGLAMRIDQIVASEAPACFTVGDLTEIAEQLRAISARLAGKR